MHTRRRHPALTIPLLFLLVLAQLPLLRGEPRGGEAARPNLVVIFCDDLGYGDIGCFGARGIRTPSIDSLARAGTRFTSFYVAQPVCSASRAALMTGCYPNRIGIHGALGPSAKTGLSTNEWTLARMLKSRGYATALFGKWHLGRPEPFLPTHHGFDEYLGLPYSNDMWPNHPTAKPGDYPPLPLIEGDRVIETMPDQRFLTRRYTERAVSFIDRHHGEPFFLYLAHSMPHVPLFVSPEFEGHSQGGLYGDVIEEIDWSVGRILEALKRHGLVEQTWIIFTSDNGPWHAYGNHAGSAGPLREGKASVFEGGVRVPCVMSWPGHIPEGRTCAEPLMTIESRPFKLALDSIEAELDAARTFVETLRATWREAVAELADAEARAAYFMRQAQRQQQPAKGNKPAAQTCRLVKFQNLSI